MNDTYIRLGYVQICLAAALLIVNGLASVLLRLGLERQLAIAALRTVVQLSLIGFVLQWVFAVNHPLLVVAALLIMTLVAGVSAGQRVELRFPGIWSDCLVAMFASSWLIGAVTLLGIIRCEPWYSPQYVIPLLGMILGNTLSGISLGLDRLTKDLHDRRDAVECLLAMGATRWEAALPIIRDATRTGMIPIINMMTIVGLVSLPGMMTGQILAGQDPADAVKYQIVIIFVIASSTALGTLWAVMRGYRRLFDAHHRFLAIRLGPAASARYRN